MRSMDTAPALPARFFEWPGRSLVRGSKSVVSKSKLSAPTGTARDSGCERSRSPRELRRHPQLLDGAKREALLVNSVRPTLGRPALCNYIFAPGQEEYRLEAVFSPGNRRAAFPTTKYILPDAAPSSGGTQPYRCTEIDFSKIIISERSFITRGARYASDIA